MMLHSAPCSWAMASSRMYCGTCVDFPQPGKGRGISLGGKGPGPRMNDIGLEAKGVAVPLQEFGSRCQGDVIMLQYKCCGPKTAMKRYADSIQ